MISTVSLTQHSIPFFRALAKPALLRCAFKAFSTLNYTPHHFSFDDACKHFVNAEKRRVFAPMMWNTKNSELAITSSYQPVKKVLIPFFGANLEWIETHYRAEWGETHYYTTTDDKGNITTHSYTVYHDISGAIRGKYHPEGDGMLIYGGFSWDSSIVEKAFSEIQFTEKLRYFDSKLVDKNTFIDPFHKRVGIGREIAEGRIKSYEYNRVKDDIYRRTWSSDVRNVKMNFIGINNLKIDSFLLSGFICQYPDNPPRVMSAVNDQINISGPYQISVAKTMSATAAVIGIAAAFLPPTISIPARIIATVISSVTSGVWAKYRLSIKYSRQQGNIENEKLDNENVAETISDKKRREATDGISAPTPTLDIDPSHCELLGLDPKQLITEEMVRHAFNEQIKLAHPDHKSGSSQKAVKVLQSRDALLSALNRKNNRRSFATSTLVKEPPRSVKDSRARILIDTVLVEKNYSKALRLVEKDEIHPDAHDKDENTLLAEAAKKGDLKAIEFAVTKLGASVDTSCDCPAHRTPLHYAVANGNVRAVELLLKLEANPNLINSYGETALDIAKNSEIKQLLINKGGIQHSSVEGKSGFWRRLQGSTIGYSSNERTRLIGGTKELPSPKKK